MKSIALASLLFVLSGPVMADHFAMLAGYRDTARLQKTEGVIVTSAVQSPLLQYTKAGRAPVQIHLGILQQTVLLQKRSRLGPPNGEPASIAPRRRRASYRSIDDRWPL